MCCTPGSTRASATPEPPAEAKDTAMSVDEQVLQDRMAAARIAIRTGVARRRESPFAGVAAAQRLAWRFARRNPPAALSALFIITVTLAAVFAPVVAPYDPLAIAPAERLQGPSADH